MYYFPLSGWAQNPENAIDGPGQRIAPGSMQTLLRELRFNPVARVVEQYPIEEYVGVDTPVLTG